MQPATYASSTGLLTPHRYCSHTAYSTTLDTILFSPSALLNAPAAACRSRESLQGWCLYLRLALPSTAMLCMEWWSYEICILMAGWLATPQLQVAVMGLCMNTTGERRRPCSCPAPSMPAPPLLAPCVQPEHSYASSAAMSTCAAAHQACCLLALLDLQPHSTCSRWA